MTELSRRERNKIDTRKRILAAAIGVYARDGYTGATMDAIAAAANISKPTLYQYFRGKTELYQQMLLERCDGMMLAFDVHEQEDMVEQLHRFAWEYAATVMHPNFLSLARLIISEAQRVPEIGRIYQRSGPDRVLAGLMGYLDKQRQAGRLQFEDSELAAQDFWGLILSAPRNQALHDPDAIPSETELTRYINNGLRVYLRAYSCHSDSDLTALNAVVQQHTANPARSHRALSIPDPEDA